MMSINKYFFALFILFATAFQAAAAPRVPEILTQNGLIYCTNAAGVSFNPQTADAGTTMNVVTEQIYNKLFEIKNNSSQVSPVLAKSYRISADGLTITIELRRGVAFHHTPWFTPTRDFNADDVLFSLNRILGGNSALPELDLPKESYTNPQYRIFYEQAKKVRFPYFDSIRLKDKIKSITALSPYTVEIKLTVPDASILAHLASQYAIIFSQEYALQLNADDNLAQLDLEPVGTGPYQVKDYLRNQHIRLIRHEDYWGKKPAIKNMIIDLSTEKTGRLAKFFNNECQITAYPEVSQLGLLNFSPEQFKLDKTDGMNLAFIAFNFEKERIRDINLRQAIAQSIDRKRIIKHIYYDTATVANSVIPMVSWAIPNDKYLFDYGYDPATAKTVLAPQNLTLKMWVVDEEQVYNPAPAKMAELIKFDLAQVGVKLQVKSVTRNYLVQQLKAKTADYDLILTGWVAGTLDPDTFLRPILSCSTKDDVTNLANWCFLPFDSMLDLALIHTQQQKRAEDYGLAQRMIFAQLPIVPIANMKRLLVINNRVKGVELTPFGSIAFEKLSYDNKSGDKR
ncbi:cationic peptide transport system substrate-binding protein [Cricetibacter osteomyelitidis]|uniref:Cationic peptide transport system substrate-binding protein n=1 Tax=Cricetibacter osteomyelitidis TaxID=1521931 RepID=A0A4R2SPS3_9PAST|nr:ABC transporter substrate-binding protein [Cricetibacter osteomyelitidis]TCP92167.1 cationic peptide transport system substrate-binding protein [Cricetibacter osteomyelitidis]